jgi:hypothetical protein
VSIIKIGKFLLILLAVFFLVACQTTTPSLYSQHRDEFQEKSDLLEAADGLYTPGVREALDWFARADRPDLRPHSLINWGAHPDIVMALVERQGALVQGSMIGYVAPGTHGSVAFTPFGIANTFQAAVAAARPDLAERIAIFHAKQMGDYREGVPLGSIPSVHDLARQPMTPREGKLHFNRYDNRKIDEINAEVPATAYVDPPGRGLLFRYAANHHSASRHEFKRIQGFDDWRVIQNNDTWTEGGKGALASEFAQYHRKRQLETLAFIYNNFGGDPNEAMPYCILRLGSPYQFCTDFTPTQLSALTMTKIDPRMRSVKGDWRLPGKLDAMVSIGGDPKKTDPYGNDAIALALNGGKFPGAKTEGNGFDFGQIFAGAMVVAGSAYIANEGGYTQAAELLSGGLTDVVTGTTNNLTGMVLRERARTAESEVAFQQKMQTLANARYITPTSWAANADLAQSSSHSVAPTTNSSSNPEATREMTGIFFVAWQTDMAISRIESCRAFSAAAGNEGTDAWGCTILRRESVIGYDPCQSIGETGEYWIEPDILLVELVGLTDAEYQRIAQANSSATSGHISAARSPDSALRSVKEFLESMARNDRDRQYLVGPNQPTVISAVRERHNLLGCSGLERLN